MKKFLQFSGIISAALALAAFIFMMAGNGLIYKSGDTAYLVPGTRVIFGGEVEGLGGLITTKYNLAATALIAWIFVLLAALILIVGAVLPMLKVHALDKIAGLLNLIAVAMLVVGGILLFFSKAAFSSANNNYFDDYGLAFAFVMAAILAIAGGVIAILPAAMDFVGKKK